MTGYLPPGCTQTECDQAQPGYWDDDEAPQQWFECEACNGEGQVFSHMSGSICSGTIDPPFEVYEPCGKCGGDGGCLDDAEPDGAQS